METLTLEEARSELTERASFWERSGAPYLAQQRLYLADSLEGEIPLAESVLGVRIQEGTCPHADSSPTTH